MAALVKSIFLESVSSILQNWTSLKIAVSNYCAGSETNEKADWLPSAICDWLSKNKNVETFELEEVLEGILLEDFNLRIEDGTLFLVCKQIIEAQNMCQQGQHLEAKQKFCNIVAVPLPPVTKPTSDNPDDSDSDDDDDDDEDGGGSREEKMDVCSDQPPQLVSIEKKEAKEDVKMEEEDGWTFIKSKKNNKRK